tara:strand:- start:131 stop:625 length:495 start_codon:yes stop_codon:yes gene_type:complete
MDSDISGISSFYDLVEKGYGLLSGEAKDIVEYVSDDVPGFISNAYDEFEDSPLFRLGKNIAGEFLSGSAASNVSGIAKSRDAGYRKQAGARETSRQGDSRGMDPRSIGYTSSVRSMMNGLEKSNIPSISNLYARLNPGVSQGPNLVIAGKADDVDLKLYEKYAG